MLVSMLSDALASARSFLFVPGDRSDRFDKAVAAGPDVVVLDLEDAVRPQAKVEARAAIRRWLQTDPAAIVAVRINSVTTPWFVDDCRLVSGLACAMMVPKTESADDLYSVRRHVGRNIPLIALIETASGVLDAVQISRAPSLVRIAYGNVDLASELGIASDDRQAHAYAQGRVVLASAAAHLAGPIAGVTTQFHDPAALRDDVAWTRRLGFTAKLCIHPSQLEVVNSAFAPTAEEVRWARLVLAALQGDAVAVVDGEMVDGPSVARARHLLRRAGFSEPVE